ncbi:MAG TPA: type II secretion system protein [Candidatus Vogelbacteria bacterium]|nr:type II secretion system protein [Candidatus Vogelbacteria bacterium]
MIAKRKVGNKGFTLVETIVAVVVLALISYLVFISFINVLKVVNYSRARSLAVLIASDKLEIARNLPYTSVGIINGQPSGILSEREEEKRGNFLFEIITNIKYVDDPFDGLWPEDNDPNDYKLVEVSIICLNCNFSKDGPLVKISTFIAPSDITALGNSNFFA